MYIHMYMELGRASLCVGLVLAMWTGHVLSTYVTVFDSEICNGRKSRVGYGLEMPLMCSTYRPLWTQGLRAYVMRT